MKIVTDDVQEIRGRIATLEKENAELRQKLAQLREELEKANAALGCGEEGWLAPNEAKRLEAELSERTDRILFLEGEKTMRINAESKCDRLEAELTAFHAAMEREKKPDWEKWLKDLSDGLDEYGNRASGLWANHQELLTTAARQLRYMADSFTLKANFVPSELRIKELEKLLAQVQSEYKILREATVGAGWISPDEANQLRDKLSWLISNLMKRSLPEPPENP